jgi:hypothetical protein
MRRGSTKLKYQSLSWMPMNRATEKRKKIKKYDT